MMKGEFQIAYNIIIWVDGTVRPWRGHNNCTGRWIYDGQVFVHKDNSSQPTPQGDK